jgi:hypothetical protein
MKRCPICNRTYTDDSLNYCLEDGTALNTVSSAAGSFDPDRTLVDPKHAASGPPPTEVLSSRTLTTEQYPSTTPTSAYQQPTPAPRVDLPRRSNTAAVVTLSVLGTIVLVMLGGFGAWLLMRSRSESSTAMTNGNSATVTDNESRNASPTPRSDNTRVPQQTLHPPSTPTSPALSPGDANTVRSQVASTLNSWAAGATSRDPDAHAIFYAPAVDPYYKRGSVSPNYVREDAARAYGMFSSINVQLSNIQVEPDPDGQHATATFDKTWNFDGAKSSSGAVQQKVWLEKLGNRWLISGEKDLKIYYLNR